MKIPFNKVYLTGDEIEYISQSLNTGNIAGDGMFDEKVCRLLEDRLDINEVMTTTSGTHALELAIMALEIGPGDQVVMPSFTFPSSANAVMLRGGIPVFAEIEKETLGLDPEDVKRKLTKNTKAIMPVHYGGIGCKMDQIMEIARDNEIYVVEDAAQAVGSKYKDKFLGTWGDIGCYSFHGTKNFVSGEGGAMAINNGHELTVKAEILRQKGTNRMQFLKGEVDKYTWVDVGSSYAPSDLLMALLYSQLTHMKEITRKRRIISERYMEKMTPYLHRGHLFSMSSVPENFESNYHNFYVVFNDEEKRESVRKRLNHRGIGAVIHFVPLHASPVGAKLGYASQDLDFTDKIGRTLLRLPLYTDMTMEEQEYVLREFSLAMEGIHG
ncbi:dTDP-4-amino-4,6-dideoxygalactose transaminase [Alkalibacter mobilis]|uniref:dTDP-4-amino-4,6-dideoxygalactose transaminase n=1 Tax=Alkalibacter mobilis TaxID=2787712 RepID=UPI00189DF277|nr:dTDP-4-amino-4,6-dideoxygalactose transaminase [Alkalibacter mobilis]MBF7096233.1 dTDP-4-amino-4,6-dideoxygalactose transaminase [Alkalibacter mobilis]